MQLGLFILPAKREFRPGEPLARLVRLRNNSTERLGGIHEYTIDHYPQLFDAQGNRVEFPAPSRSAPIKVEAIIGPGQSWSMGLGSDLNELRSSIPTVPPGEYTMRQQVQLKIGDETVALVSGAVPIKILPAGEPR